MHQKSLLKLLLNAEERRFFQMIWAIDALQGDRQGQAEKLLRFPPEAASSEITSRYAVHRWELETLVNLFLTRPFRNRRKPNDSFLNCGQYETLATLINHLREIEDAEAGMYLGRVGILNEMHRIAQRQFPWQRGFFNAVQFYRYAFIYGQGDCADYFNATYGITFDTFSYIGFALFTAFQERPWIKNKYSLTDIGIKDDELCDGMKLLCKPEPEAEKEATALLSEVQSKLKSPLPTAFQPSYLRRFPILSFGDVSGVSIAPLPALLILRVTQGVYYDLIDGGSHLRNDASARFEKYCRQLLRATLPDHEIEESHTYSVRGKLLDSPDILIKRDGVPVAVLECKATKLTIGAQYAEDPTSEAEVGYREIAKGVFQIWRYRSHIRRGLTANDATERPNFGLVLMLDTWLSMSRELQKQVVSVANSLADAAKEDIIEEDRERVIFCSIPDFERLLLISDNESFFLTLSAAKEEKFVGWHLPEIHREIHGKTQKKPFPFSLADVSP